MAGFDGNGVWTRQYSWTQDAANGLFIDASRMDSDWSYIASGFNNCLTRDGQGKPSGPINWNGQNLTNIAVLTTTNNAVIGGNLTVSGVQAFTGAATFGGDITVAGAGRFSAGILVAATANANALQLTGNDGLAGCIATGSYITFSGTASATPNLIAFSVNGGGVATISSAGLALQTPLSIFNGGTGATTTAAARANIGGNAIGLRFVQAIGADPTSAVGDIVYEY